MTCPVGLVPQNELPSQTSVLPPSRRLTSARPALTPAGRPSPCRPAGEPRRPPVSPASVPGSDPDSPAGTASVSVTTAPYDASRTTRPRERSSCSRRPASAWDGVDLDQVAPLPAQHAGLVDRERDRVGVGPHQAADPEQGAAEPPGHHGHDVAQLRARAASPASAHRPTRRARRRRWTGPSRRRRRGRTPSSGGRRPSAGAARPRPPPGRRPRRGPAPGGSGTASGVPRPPPPRCVRAPGTTWRRRDIS